jgi:hypothetical protein
MSKKSIALLFLLVASPLIIYMLWPTDEARIKKLVRQEAHAIEAEDIEEVMSHVSFNYQDEYGLSYVLVKKLMERQFQRYSGMEVEYDDLKVVVAEGEKEATASMDLRVMARAGQEMGYLLGGEEPVRLKLMLKKGGPLGTWQVASASGFMEGAKGRL